VILPHRNFRPGAGAFVFLKYTQEQLFAGACIPAALNASGVARPEKRKPKSPV
jgi:hypothetical protein